MADTVIVKKKKKQGAEKKKKKKLKGSAFASSVLYSADEAEELSPESRMSLRWDGQLEDEEAESLRIAEYKRARRQRYQDAQPQPPP